VQRGQLDILYVVKDDRAAMRVVRLGEEIDEGVEILAGLEEGESIVAGPPFNLRGGQLVEVLT
jgi:multidrug efflux pump subunit AcrA (membrane-fusion protein)